jgi:mycothiol system anti-sigma-R factor
MADCNDTLRELDAYLDHEISDHLQHEIDHHLGDCVDCQQAFEFHFELKQVIRDKCSRDEIPPSLLSRIEQCFGEDFDGDGRIG